MPRGPRLLYDGAVYHIINRGHNRQILFKDSYDYEKLRVITKTYKEKYKFKLFNYCLMINHFHLLIRVREGRNLPKIMQSISQAYAKYHKRRYGNIGYLFQGRYKSLLIKEDSYLSECARYIERNPLRAGIVQELSDYSWSSYNYYANGKNDDIIDTNPAYHWFGKTPQERQVNYKAYVETTRPYEELMDKAIRRYAQ